MILVIEKHFIPTVRDEVLTGLDFSQDMFVQFVAFTLPQIDQFHPAQSIELILDELITSDIGLTNFAVDSNGWNRDWVGHLYDEYVKVWEALGKHFYPFMDSLPPHIGIDTVDLEVNTVPRCYVFKVETYDQR